MKKSSLLAVVALTGAAAVMLAGCCRRRRRRRFDGGDGGDAAATRACVILGPTPPRRPAGRTSTARTSRRAWRPPASRPTSRTPRATSTSTSTIADQQLTKGCGVMLLVDYQGAAAGRRRRRRPRASPVIAYDRPFAGADYYVSFDNVRGRRASRARPSLDGLEAAGKDPATADRRLHGRRPDRRQRRRCSTTAPSRSWRRRASSRPPSPRGLGPGEVADQLRAGADRARRQGRRRVGSANDTNAAGVIKVLQDNNLTGVAVSGQDA